MSTFVRSALVALALVGSVSTASATTYSYSSAPVPAQGKMKHDARDFFQQLKKNGN
jgi:hypothetical protein